MATNTKSFSIQEAIRFGWETTKKNLWFLVGITVIIGFIQFIPNLLESYIRDQNFLIILVNVISYLVSLGISLGAIKIYLSFVDKKKSEFSDLFSYFDPKLMWRYFLASFIYGIIVIIGFILFIIPGVYISIKYGLYAYLIVDKNLGVFESFTKSGEITKGRTWELFVFGLVLGLIVLAGLLALGVGVLVAAPVVSIAEAYVYRRLSSKK